MRVRLVSFTLVLATASNSRWAGGRVEPVVANVVYGATIDVEATEFRSLVNLTSYN